MRHLLIASEGFATTGVVAHGKGYAQRTGGASRFFLKLTVPQVTDASNKAFASKNVKP